MRWRSPITETNRFLALALLAGVVGAGCASNGTASMEGPGEAVLNLTVDANRDGKLDPGTDDGLEDSWSPTEGALFLFNCDSDEDSGEPDWIDDKVNGDADLEDMAKIHLKVPGPGPATLSITEGPAEMVRLFGRSAEGTYEVIQPGVAGNLDAYLSDGEALVYIEGKSFATPDWDGRVVLSAAQGESNDSVRLGVAPFIMLSNIKDVKQVYVRDFPDRNEKLIEQLSELVPAAGAELIVVPGEDETPYRYNSIWFQDTMEVGYTEMPGKSINVVLKANRNKSLDNYPKNEMLGPDYGWFEYGTYRPAFAEGSGGKSWIDWYGNLEVTPPLPGNPLGIIYYGKDGSDALNPEVTGMLDAQRVQAPTVALDVSWLQIKHVDEMVCFVPAKTDGDMPYKVLVPDMNLMFDLLDQWVEAGHGDLEWLGPYADYFGSLEKYDKVTLKAVQEDEELRAYATKTQTESLEPMIQSLKDSFGVTDEMLVRVPFLQSASKETIVPNMINSLIANGHIIVTDPHGPVVDGQDQLRKYFVESMKDAAVEVHFVDDRQYHKWSGNVHCATNTRREGFEPNFWSAMDSN